MVLLQLWFIISLELLNTKDKNNKRNEYDFNIKQLDAIYI